jgi:hypothetical protein
VTLQRSNPRATPRWLTLLIIVALTLAFGATSLLAAHGSVGTSNFEITDGNLILNGTSPHIDWASVSETRKADTPSGQGDNSFTQGTDEQDEPPIVGAGGIPPSKSDLETFGVYTETVGTNSYLHMFWVRVQDPSGTTNMDFEFNQNTCNPPSQTAGCSANGVTPTRLPGDLLVTYNLGNGGTSVDLFLHEWVTTGACEDSQEGGSGGGTASVASPCWSVGEDLDAAAAAAGSVNTVAIPSGQADGLGALDARTFGEASLDLQAVFGQSCFSIGSAYLKSRSSDTFTSAMKDFIAPTPFNISNCGSLKIVKQDDAGTLLAGASFKVYKDDGDGVAELGGQDVQIGSECTTTSDGTGNCTFSNLFFGSYWVDETVTPSGYDGDANDPRLVSVPNTTQVTVTYTNPREHKVIVLVCHTGTNTLAASDVYAGANDTTPDGTTLSAAPAGITEAQLCALTGGTFSGLSHGDLGITVDVGSDAHAP